MHDHDPPNSDPDSVAPDQPRGSPPRSETGGRRRRTGNTDPFPPVDVTKPFSGSDPSGEGRAAPDVGAPSRPARGGDWTWPNDDEIPVVELAPPTPPPVRERLRARSVLADRYLTAPGVPQPRRPARRVAKLALWPIVLLTLAAAGYVAGHGGLRSEPAPPALTQQTARSGVGLRYPQRWTLDSTVPDIPGLSFEKPLVVSSGALDDTSIVAGVVRDAIGSDLLPTALRRRMPDAADGEPVLLGDIQALRYERVAVDGMPGPLTLYAAPTDKGSVVVACVDRAEGTAIADTCARSAATLRLEGVRVFPVGPDAAYGRRVAAAIERLDRTLKDDGARLRKAGSASAQGQAADAIEATFTRVARSLGSGRLSARDRYANADLVSAVRAVGRVYGLLASAARAADRQRYNAARDTLPGRQSRLREAIAALQVLGYETEAG